MSEMKWIKIVTDIVDDEKMLMIEMLCPNGAKRDAVQLMWFNVLTLAGKLNDGGRLAVKRAARKITRERNSDLDEAVMYVRHMGDNITRCV